MDYSKLSDNKINAEVALHWLGKGNFGLMNGAVETFGGSFNPCNNPADAWPIIQKSGISLVYDGDDWLALHFSRPSLTYPSDHRKHPNKPFRAALILWLMMQESE
jgi:hypothetical protein